ncbi:MAG: GNAT family N-acetyltransferase, partial [Candidatus Odinarchaeia archaeon]
KTLLLNSKNLLKAAFNFGPLSKNDFYIEALSIKPKFRRRGLASYLLDFVEKFSLEKGYKRIILEVNENNQPAFTLYRKKGFSVYKQFKINIGDAYCLFKKMIKVLC